MKKLFIIFLSLVMILSFCSCGAKKTPSGVIVPEDDGIVDNLVINGEEVSAVDFVTESVNKYIARELTQLRLKNPHLLSLGSLKVSTFCLINYTAF